MHIRLFFLACLLCTGVQAQTVYKCNNGGNNGGNSGGNSGGATTYSDRPCADGPSRALPPPPAGISAADTLGPQGGDARTLLEVEKLRIAREKAEAKDEREQQRLARAATARRKKCDKLRLRQRWTQEDEARATGAKRETLRLKLRRQAETLAVECPA